MGSGQYGLRVQGLVSGLGLGLKTSQGGQSQIPSKKKLYDGSVDIFMIINFIVIITY